MSSLNPQIFRAYDIRGVADRDLTDDTTYRVARAFGTLLREQGASRVALGRDCRLSSERLQRAFSRGLIATGLDVADVGVGGSPQLYWAVQHLGTDGGVQITGSHNPADQNGFKLLTGTSAFYGQRLLEVMAIANSQAFASGTGQLVCHDLRAAYVEDIAGRLSLGPRRLRVAIDGGNGTGGPPAMSLLERLGVAVTPLHVAMDGRFPAHHPDPTIEENLTDLRHAVRAHGLDLGIAYDGDADRIGVIDERGAVIWGDRLLILLAREVLSRHPGATIVGEVKCSGTLFADIANHGGRPVMSAVGHSIIKERMKAEGALLAGEMSGHVFYKDRWLGFDDAIYVTGRLLEILSHTDVPLSALLTDVPVTHVSPEIRLECADERKFAVVGRAIAHYRPRYPIVDIDGARIDFGDGWGLIRASNTQPAIVLRVEGQSAEALARIRAELEAFVARGA